MKKIPLYPFAVGRNFQVGEPLNEPLVPYGDGMVPCRCPGRDYSGRDPEIQYPAGWHVKAGFGLANGVYCQDCDRFEPWRVRVMDFKKRRVIRGEGGDGQRAGSWMVSRRFDRSVFWADGNAVLCEYVFLPSSEMDVRMYMNAELRGELSTKFKSEIAQGFGFHMAGDEIMAAYWRDGKDGDGLDEARREHRNIQPLRFDRWHRLLITMTPVQPEYTWRVDAVLRVQQKEVWALHTDESNHPNHIVDLGMFAFGKEREKTLSGGAWYVSRAMCWMLDRATP